LNLEIILIPIIDLLCLANTELVIDGATASHFKRTTPIIHQIIEIVDDCQHSQETPADPEDNVSRRMSTSKNKNSKRSAKSKDSSFIINLSDREFMMKGSERLPLSGYKPKKNAILTLQRLKEFNANDLRTRREHKK
jgi:hypothetical protein